MEGYFVISRKLLEDEMYLSERFSRGQAWIDLIGLAAFKDTIIYKRGIKIDVPRGCLATSTLWLASRWGWHRETVSKFLDILQDRQQIRQQKSRITTLISICNYEQYQLEPTTNPTTSPTPKPATKEKDINNNNIPTQEDVRTCVRDCFGEEIYLTDIWIEKIQMYVYSEFKKKLTPDDVTRAFNKFAIEKQAHTERIYRQDFISHFASWVKSRIEKSKQESHGTGNINNSQAGDKQREYEQRQSAVADLVASMLSNG